MKKVWLLLGVLLAIPMVFAALDRSCFENWKQVACGVENWPPNESFCSDVKLEVIDCYNDGENFYANFTGIENFSTTELYKGLAFDIASRTKLWRGSMAITSPEGGYDVLPQGAVISGNQGNYLFYAPIGNYSITGFQITVPYCYRIEDNDHGKIYPQTQAGKACRTVKKEAEVAVAAPAAEEKQPAVQPEIKKVDWNLGLTVILIVIIIVLLFMPRKKLKKGTNK